MDVERLFQLYFNEHQDFYISQLMFKDPFDLQVTEGCELHSGKGFLGFKQVAIQGHDFMSFQNETFLPSPKGGEKAQKACKLLNFNEAYTQRLYRLLSDTCPRFTLGLLEAGKAHLQQLVKPEAWLSRGHSPGPGHLLLVCHVSGFYPKPVWVMWMRGDQEQRGTQRGDILPNAAPQSALGLILFAMIVALALLTGLGFWFRKRWICCSDLASVASTLNGTGC
ncbi:T-cell surface glycoprotein CD1a-like [Marmota monax]|uniref:T-cell surface glycoprotein CD1a-like n=1 Tax=Marmota monax TaxID=9995 RepID=UPI001EB0102C|nr:T-cell surface glycoprotein CD1a-like [Marmota monax]